MSVNIGPKSGPKSGPKLIAIIVALDNGAKPRSFATTINVVKIYIQLVFPLIIL